MSNKVKEEVEKPEEICPDCEQRCENKDGAEEICCVCYGLHSEEMCAICWERRP